MSSSWASGPPQRPAVDLRGCGSSTWREGGRSTADNNGDGAAT